MVLVKLFATFDYLSKICPNRFHVKILCSTKTSKSPQCSVTLDTCHWGAISSIPSKPNLGNDLDQLPKGVHLAPHFQDECLWQQ